MKDTIKFEFNSLDENMIVDSLCKMRNDLISQDRDVNAIDDILLKLSDSYKIEFDKYEIGIVINALNQVRTEMKQNNESTININELILKIIDETNSKKKILLRTLRKDNVRK